MPPSCKGVDMQWPTVTSAVEYSINSFVEVLVRSQLGCVLGEGTPWERGRRVEKGRNAH